MLLLLVAFPDGNDFAGATLDKHARLDAQTGRKIVFVGGSNLAYGLDSPAMERELGVPVVNMGMNAYLGLRFLLNEVRGSLKAGDVAVLALEYETYFTPAPFDAIEGAGPDHLMLLKVRPASVRYITRPRQFAAIATAVPYAAQQKVLRLLEASLDGMRGQVQSRSLIEQVESRGGFNAHGDLVSHLGVQWPYAVEAGDDLSRKQLNPAVIRHLQRFRDEMNTRGVAVVIVPPPAPTPYYRQHRASMEAIFAQLDRPASNPPGQSTRAAEYTFPASQFFDNFNHLSGEGRKLRTLRLIDDLRPVMASSATFRTASP